jgi:UDP-glucose 4-epimerase
MKAVVTGGAGFIGSHLVDALLREGQEVLIVDDLSGANAYINPKARFVKKSILADLSAELKDADTIFHFAASPDVRWCESNPEKAFRANVEGTKSLAQSCMNANHIVFASTSAIYGEAEMPTPEGATPKPISVYGKTKLEAEKFLTAFCKENGIKLTILRYANIFGEHSTRGVMYDFYKKLQLDPGRLEILGDGAQEKSFLHISDCISATLTAWKTQKTGSEAFNVGSRNKIRVSEIAKLVCKEMGLRPKMHYTGTPRGWPGDVRLMLLSVSKLKKLGWSENVSFEAGLRRYVKWLSGINA